MRKFEYINWFTNSSWLDFDQSLLVQILKGMDFLPRCRCETPNVRLVEDSLSVIDKLSIIAKLHFMEFVPLLLESILVLALR